MTTSCVMSLYFPFVLFLKSSSHSTKDVFARHIDSSKEGIRAKEDQSVFQHSNARKCFIQYIFGEILMQIQFERGFYLLR